MRVFRHNPHTILHCSLFSTILPAVTNLHIVSFNFRGKLDVELQGLNLKRKLDMALQSLNLKRKVDVELQSLLE